MRISDWSSDVCSSDLIVAVLLRDGTVILLDAALHFREQPVGQRLARLHRRFEIGVFLLQIGQHLPVLHLRIAGVAQPGIGRSEERRVGKECVSTGRSRWSPFHYKKKTKKIAKR